MLHWYLLGLLALHLSGAASLTVHGQKGGSVSLPCNCSRENVSIRLTNKNKVAFGNHQNDQYKNRVFESGHCDLNIRDLKTTDAGIYSLSIYEHGDPISIFHYQILVNDSLTGRKGEELVFDDLPLEAEKVEHCKGTVCTEMWRKERGVLNDRLNDSNGRLAIREFKSSDAGIYRIRNSTGGELVTTYVTESEGNLTSTDDHRTDDTEQHSAWVWIVVPVALIVFILITRQYLNRNKRSDSY
ncbi:uncharacterized protein LOC143738190 isoform X2 [Siphateles boraxobius]|uniref:uncharacterized protein LOC143738190 isoform X2 n=1 Tax=Siphateles boraxobius TaxID=180520 RepID=UPI0040637A80